MLYQLPFSLDKLPSPSYLVGGAVRDALLNRRKTDLDLDLILPVKAIETASKIAKEYKAGFVVLDAEHQIARVVFDNLTVDFAQRAGESLETDLSQRDFTLNAIAYSFQEKTLIDPLKGEEDIQGRVIKMISPANLENDPLRLLRAYRLAAQLNFTIESVTRETLRAYAPMLAKVAAERVRAEINYLLGAESGSYWLAEAWLDGLLQVWLSNITQEKVKSLALIDSAAGYLAKTWPANFATLEPSWYGLSKLAALVSENLLQAKAELSNLRYSSVEVKSVLKIIKILAQLKEVSLPVSIETQYFLFKEAQQLWPLVAALAIAQGVALEIINPMVERYLDPEDPIAHPVAIVNGDDLIEALKIKPGPLMKELLTKIQIAYLEGIINNREEGLILAETLIRQKNE